MANAGAQTMAKAEKSAYAEMSGAPTMANADKSAKAGKSVKAGGAPMSAGAAKEPEAKALWSHAVLNGLMPTACNAVGARCMIDITDNSHFVVIGKTKRASVFFKGGGTPADSLFHAKVGDGQEVAIKGFDTLFAYLRIHDVTEKNVRVGGGLAPSAAAIASVGGIENSYKLFCHYCRVRAQTSAFQQLCEPCAKSKLGSGYYCSEECQAKAWQDGHQAFHVQRGEA